ncbi:MAG: PEP-CTERM sorting domain-containing protein [Gammaproteobacteria bacterium]|nr:PEP-CTERM sorting domain-containing protein [Gammaproteobacteria bacterium]MDH3857820.1 PEP-CTERM sorting domain-containing protein [Gammaproteobacteria bacterium]
MKYKAKLMAAMTLLVVSLSAQGALIIDQDVEDDGDWSGNLFSTPWNADGFGFLSPGHQEGKVAAVFQNNDSISTTFSSLTLQQGMYTLEFALGNYSNFPFPAVQINFAGLTLGDASASTTLTPASGGWSLWTINFNVVSGNTNLGNTLGFSLSTTDATLSNLAFDGVGNLSNNGNGFLVSYTPSTSVPEPSIIALFAAGLFGVGFARRRMRS